MKNNLVVIGIVTLIIGAIGGFLGGMKYQQNNASSSQFAGRTGNGTGIGNGGRFGQRGGGTGGTAVTGEVIASDDTSVTVKLLDGSSKIILLSDKTTFNKASEGTKADVKVGERVAAFGTTNSDGSVTATNVQINPTFGIGGGNRVPNQAQKSADAKEYVVTASNYKFSPIKITVKKGEKSRIVLKNTEGMHDFRVDELKISTAVIGNGQEDFVEFTPDKTGTFEFYCSVGNHRAMGMVGTIVVE